MADVKIRYVGEDDASDEGDKVASSIKGIETAAGNAKGGVSSFFKDAFSFVTGGLITSAISGITGAVGGLVSGMVEGNAEFETYETQFGVLLGSADAAKQRLKDLAAFGASTPFDLPEVVKANKVLQSFGLYSEESAQKFGKSGDQIMRIAGDVASGTGASFEDISLMLGKLSAGATGEVISRMAELGIASKAELAKMGLEFDKGGALLSPLPQAMQVVTDLMNTKFGGMMDKQSQTFEGMKSNFNDWIQGTIRAAGAPVFEGIKAGLGQLLTAIQTPAFSAAITAISTLIGSGLGSALNTAVPLIIGLINTFASLATGGDALGSVFSGALGPAMAFFKTIGDYMVAGWNDDGALGGIVGAISGFLDALGMGEDQVTEFSTALWDNLQKMIADVIKVFNAIKDTVFNVLGAVVELIKAELAVVVQFISDHGDEIMADVKKAWDSIIEIITLALKLINATIVPLLKAIAKFIGEHGTEIGTVFKGAWDVVSGIVQTALDLIKGIIKIALQLLNGDTSGALDTLKATFTSVWDDIKKIVSGAWDFISGIVKLATDAINKLTGQQSTASGIRVDYNPNYVGGVAGAGDKRPDGSVQMAGDSYTVNSVSVADDIQKARKMAAQSAMLRATVGV